MSNTPTIKRNTSEPQQRVKARTPRPAQPRPQKTRLATRDPRRKRG